MIVLSIVVPVFNEEEAVPLFISSITPFLDRCTPDWEVVFVNDGSRDATWSVIQAAAAADPRVRGVSFARNFGKEAALTAGLAETRGQAIVPMDVDLQDPPELVVEFFRIWRAGEADTVFGRRVSRGADTWLKRQTAGGFYKLFNRIASHRIEENVGDFRLMDRKVVDAVLALPEKNRFMKGLFSWVGFRSVGVPYERPERSVGTTKFNYWKLWNFALDGITGFSTLPLRVWTYVGVAVGCVAFAFAVWVLVRTLIWGPDTPGYASLMIVVLFLGGVQLVSLGVIGEYLGRLYTEVKGRPLYIIAEKV
jgi:glycosyltransferase involved in cell wall biosynthesis